MSGHNGNSPVLRRRAWAQFYLCTLLALLVLMFTVVEPARAAPDYPQLTGQVVDEAGIMDPVTAAQLESELAGQEQKTSDQLVVATVRSLDGQPIEDYANGLFRAWKLGQKKENNGILLLIAPNERKVRIEVGYGLEGIMTDAMSSMIIQNAIIPEFKAGNMGQGAVKGAQAILEVLNMDPDEARDRARALENVQDSLTDDDILDIIFFVLFIAFVIFVMWRSSGDGPGGRRRRRIGDALAGGTVSTWDWGSGSSGGGGWSDGGGWSGGGGSSGGGGASGSW